jgi:hypothetical protein
MTQLAQASPVTPGVMLGDEWWQQLASYGIGRWVDSEFLLPYTTKDPLHYGVDENGRIYSASATQQIIPGVSNGLVVVAGAVLALSLLYLIVKD